jgi:hypothetical protein
MLVDAAASCNATGTYISPQQGQELNGCNGVARQVAVFVPQHSSLLQESELHMHTSGGRVI